MPADFPLGLLVDQTTFDINARVPVSDSHIAVFCLNQINRMYSKIVRHIGVDGADLSHQQDRMSLKYVSMAVCPDKALLSCNTKLLFTAKYSADSR